MLAETVARAGEYKRSDYTAESYNTLVEALNRANVVLSNSAATQDEVDEALLVLENAIGMLVLANNAPSGTDSYNSGVGGSDDPNSSSAVSSGDPSDNTGSNSEQTSGGSSQTSSGTSGDSIPETEKSNPIVMWLVIIMAVLAVAAGAIIAVLKMNKKK